MPDILVVFLKIRGKEGETVTGREVDLDDAKHGVAHFRTSEENSCLIWMMRPESKVSLDCTSLLHM